MTTELVALFKLRHHHVRTSVLCPFCSMSECVLCLTVIANLLAFQCLRNGLLTQVSSDLSCVTNLSTENLGFLKPPTNHDTFCCSFQDGVTATILHIPANTIQTAKPTLVNRPVIVYDGEQLLSYRYCNSGQISQSVLRTIDKMGIGQSPGKAPQQPRRKRGRRGGRHVRRPITVRISHHPNNTKPIEAHRVCFYNIVNIHRNGNSTKSVQLPSIFMTNTQSLLNKFDELDIIFREEQVDIGVITES